MGASELELRVAWQRHLGRGDAATRAFESLIERHRSSGRHYHDVRHVQWVVRHVLEIVERVGVDDLDAVVAAAFFHDSVYEVDRSDNETRSADLAAATLRDLGWSDDRCDRVASMIVATQHRDDAQPDDLDIAILLAADLAVLAADPAAYAGYVHSIRREYAHLGEDEWRAGRGAVITGFLDRASIFPPRLGLDAWERRARANLTAEAAALR